MSTAVKVVFGQYNVLATQIQVISRLGEFNACSARCVPRFKDLTEEEVADLFLSAQKIANAVEKEHGGSSITMALQDGPEAGQTVHHCHVHIIPRKKGDFQRNDDVYTEIEKPRPKRTEEDMAQEAEKLSQYFKEQNEKYSLFL